MPQFHPGQLQLKWQRHRTWPPSKIKKRREKADQAFYLLNFDCVPFCFVVVGEKVSFHGLPMRMIPRGTAQNKLVAILLFVLSHQLIALSRMILVWRNIHFI